MDVQVNQREAGQASNLEKKVLKTKDSQKILVHVGYGHLMKRQQGPLKAMAERFMDDTGINPLTIDQTLFWSKTHQYEVCEVLGVKEQDASTIYVGMPPPSFTRSRPDWRLERGDKFVELLAELLNPAEPAIFEAHLSSEPDDAVPMDRILVCPYDNIPLLLPPGRYRIAAWTEKGGWSKNVSITMK